MIDKFFHFVQEDIQIRYNANNLPYEFVSKKGYTYFLMVFYSGKAEIHYDDEIYIAKPGDVFIANKNENYSIEFGKVFTEYLDVRFSATFFHEIDKSVDLLLPFFENRKIKIYKSLDKIDTFNVAIKNIMRALENRQSRVFVLSPFLQIICLLYDIYIKQHPHHILETDSNFAKIVHYIDIHLFEDITLKSVAEGVYVSEKCVSSSIKRICNQTFLENITERRLNVAKSMFSLNMSLKQIAAHCGFKTYSTFYRQFTKSFGITPKEYLEKVNSEKTKS